MTLDGKEVLETMPDFADEPELQGARTMVLPELNLTRKVGFVIGQKPVHVLRHRYALKGQAILDFEKFFNDRRGVWQDFLVPSWHSELGNGETNPNPSASGQPFLNVDWCDYPANYGPADGRLGRYVFLLWDDGTFFAAKVLAVISNAGVTDELELSANLPKAVNPDDSTVIGFLYHCRFASDELEFEYAGTNNARTEMAYLEHVISTPEADVT